MCSSFSNVLPCWDRSKTATGHLCTHSSAVVNCPVNFVPGNAFIVLTQVILHGFLCLFLREENSTVIPDRRGSIDRTGLPEEPYRYCHLSTLHLARPIPSLRGHDQARPHMLREQRTQRLIWARRSSLFHVLTFTGEESHRAALSALAERVVHTFGTDSRTARFGLL